MVERNRFNWRLPLCAVLGSFVVFIPIAIWQSDAIPYLFLVVPVVSLLSGVFLLRAAIARNLRLCLSLLSMLCIYWAISAALIRNYSLVRTTSRWLVCSHDYKSKVLGQPTPENGELKHIEWDGWGWAGQDTTVFLVFDPTDSLSAAAGSHRPGKFTGIPCRVFSVHRLESHWYTAQFYTDESWNNCN